MPLAIADSCCNDSTNEHDNDNYNLFPPPIRHQLTLCGVNGNSAPSSNEAQQTGDHDVSPLGGLTQPSDSSQFMDIFEKKKK